VLAHAAARRSAKRTQLSTDVVTPSLLYAVYLQMTHSEVLCIVVSLCSTLFKCCSTSTYVNYCLRKAGVPGRSAVFDATGATVMESVGCPDGEIISEEQGHFIFRY
jgi:hypothetical protein